jgi:Uma2 family endonuclease
MMYQSNPPRPSQTPLPTMYDLPSEAPNEPGLPDEFHVYQLQLLRNTFQPPSICLNEVFIGTDIYLYYDSRRPLWFKRPDWFVVLGVAASLRQEDMRLSYVIWQESVAPFLVVELLSPGTEDEDLGETLREINKPPTKWEVYERILRIPYYVVFDRYISELRVFKLEATRYQEIAVPQQKFWFPELEMGLGVWQGRYQQAEGKWLRWYDSQGNWLPTSQEQAAAERLRAEQERLRAEQGRSRAELAQQQLEQERLRAERLAAKLRELNLDPDEL